VLKHMPSMPKALAQAFHVIKDIKTDVFDAVLHHGTTAQLLALQQQIAERQGAIVGITHLSPSQTAIPLERFVIERAISVNTAAAGGNASLMTLN